MSKSHVRNVSKKSGEELPISYSRVLTVSEKGGVGKTAISLGLLSQYSIANKEPCSFIDLDPNAWATKRLFEEHMFANKHLTYDLLNDGEAEPIMLRENIEFYNGSIHLKDSMFRSKLENDDLQSCFADEQRHVIMDINPNLTGLDAQALTLATTLLVVCNTDFDTVEEAVAKVKYFESYNNKQERKGKEPKRIAIILSEFKKTGRESKRCMHYLCEVLPNYEVFTMPYSDELINCNAKKKLIHEYTDARVKFSSSYRAIAEWIDNG